jgi:3,4-dihydroxy 2-butanone 4-phosphate synthase/GTP cyclohydrolase II
VRMHALDLMVDLLGEERSHRRYGELQRAMQIIADEGAGVIVLLRDGASSGLSQLIATRMGDDKSGSHELRDYGVGAQILNDLNITDMVLLSNSKPTVIGLDGYGLSISGWKPIS